MNEDKSRDIAATVAILGLSAFYFCGLWALLILGAQAKWWMKHAVWAEAPFCAILMESQAKTGPLSFVPTVIDQPANWSLVHACIDFSTRVAGSNLGLQQIAFWLGQLHFGVVMTVAALAVTLLASVAVSATA